MMRAFGVCLSLRPYSQPPSVFPSSISCRRIASTDTEGTVESAGRVGICPEKCRKGLGRKKGCILPIGEKAVVCLDVSITYAHQLSIHGFLGVFRFRSMINNLDFGLLLSDWRNLRTRQSYRLQLALDLIDPLTNCLIGWSVVSRIKSHR